MGDTWKDAATAELKDIKEASGAMLPEDRVARTMDLQEYIAAKLEILKANAETELNLLPQGDKVPADAQAFKDELKRITDYVKKLQGDTKVECDKYSNDVKYWAEYRTGIKEFNPWLAAAEGLSKPSDLAEVKALDDKVKTFEKNCVNFLKVLEAANVAAQKMTTHAEADAEVAGFKERYVKVKAVSDTWVKKVEVLVKEWTLLDNTVTELNSWVAKDKSAGARTSSPWRRWSPPLENSRISSSRRRSWLRTCKELSSSLAPHNPLHPHHIHLMIDHSEIHTYR